MALEWKDPARGVWEDCPEYVQLGPASRATVQYPEYEESDGLGRPAGAFGLPKVVIEYDDLLAAGAAWWFARLGSAAYLDGFYVNAFDDRSGLWKRWTGTLQLLKHDGKPTVEPTAILHKVRVEVLNVTVTT